MNKLIFILTLIAVLVPIVYHQVSFGELHDCRIHNAKCSSDIKAGIATIADCY
jgi:uncharacterized membrane protein (DUF441 family)